jgi:hypothetical protein
LCEKDGVDDEAAVAGNLINDGYDMRQLLRGAMGSQHSEFAGDGSGAAARFVRRNRGSGKEQGLQVAVAKAVDGRLPAIDGQKERQIVGLKGVEVAYAAAISGHAFFDGGRRFAQGDTAAFVYADCKRHDEFTLAPKWRRKRVQWFHESFGRQVLST